MHLALLGFDKSSQFLLDRFVKTTCLSASQNISEPSLEQLLQHSVTLHLFPNYQKNKHLPHLHALQTIMNALLIFVEGPSHSMIFSAGENTPRQFDLKSFDQNLKK